MDSLRNSCVRSLDADSESVGRFGLLGQADRDAEVDRCNISSYMVRDDVIASPGDTMRATLQHLAERYGGIDGYLEVRSPIIAIRSLCGSVLSGEGPAVSPGTG